MQIRGLGEGSNLVYVSTVASAVRPVGSMFGSALFATAQLSSDAGPIALRTIHAVAPISSETAHAVMPSSCVLLNSLQQLKVSSTPAVPEVIHYACDESYCEMPSVSNRLINYSIC